MKPRPLRAVFFDVGGTLLRPHPSVGAVYARVGERHGFIASASDWDQAFRQAWNTARAVAGTGLMTAEKEWWRGLVIQTLDSLKLKKNECARGDYFEELYAVFAGGDAWRLYPEVVEVLHEVRTRGLHVGVISNWDVRLRPLLKALHLEERFDSITVSCEVRAEKPAPEIFQAALRAAGADPEEAVHIGDSYEEDVCGAEAVGMRAILIDRSGGPLRDCTAVPNLNEVLTAAGSGRG